MPCTRRRFCVKKATADAHSGIRSPVIPNPRLAKTNASTNNMARSKNIGSPPNHPIRNTVLAWANPASMPIKTNQGDIECCNPFSPKMVPQRPFLNQFDLCRQKCRERPCPLLTERALDSLASVIGASEKRIDSSEIARNPSLRTKTASWESSALAPDSTGCRALDR